MQTTTLLAGLLSASLLLAGCTGDDGKQITASSATGGSSSSTSGAATTKGSTSDASTTSATTGSPSTSGATTGNTGTSGTGACSGCECDIWAQDCPDGEKCTAWADDGGTGWKANKCVPVSPDPKQAGEACVAEGSAFSGLDDCDKGLMCWNVDENYVGYCIEFCMGDPDSIFCSDPDSICYNDSSGVIPLCLPSCDLLLQDCPGDTDVCLPIGDHAVCVFDGSGPEPSVDGDPCEYDTACGPGLFCADADLVPDCQAQGCCASFCDLNEPNTCPLMDQSAECVPLFEMGMAPAGMENVGFCGLP